MTGKSASGKLKKDYNSMNLDNLPFLAIETDGNLFPQIIQSKIEIFLMQSIRLHEILKSANQKSKRKYKEAFLNALNTFYGRKNISDHRDYPDYGKIIAETD